MREVPFSVSQAIIAYEEIEGERREKEGIRGRVDAAQEEHIKLYAGGCGFLPPITRIDKEGLQQLRRCKRLALSSNAIDRIPPGLSSMPNLEILSLGRNKLRRLECLDLPHLKQLWLSYNFIEKLSGAEKLLSLTTLFVSNNLIEKWAEVERLAANPHLTDLLLLNNKVHTDTDKGTEETKKEYRLQVLMRLPKLTRIDGQPVEPEERDAAEKRLANVML